MSRSYILRQGYSRLEDLANGLLAALPFVGATYWLDPAHGDDGNDGSAPQHAIKTLAAAYARCADGAHDVVLFLGGPTADKPAAKVTWAKSFTHLVGVTNPLPGMGQRCRIVNDAAVDLAMLMEVSGSGCIFQNVQWFDGKDKNEDGACLLVSGGRNLFCNCFVAGMGHATPAARAGSYSLKVTGEENVFDNCTVGLDTIERTGANSELIVAGIRNRFIHCDIRSNSVKAEKFLASFDTTVDTRDTIFEDCLFFNYSTNWATGITNAFHVPAGATHYVILRGNCQLVGVGTGWADTVTHVYGAGPKPDAGFGVSLNPTT